VKGVPPNGLWCAAYPDGVPDAIVFSRVDHHDPYAGDHGLRYSPQGDTLEEIQASEDDAAVMLALVGIKKYKDRLIWTTETGG
jgi:hypothetical protein